MKLNCVYISSKDFTRAKDWYKQILFKCNPNMETDRFAFWDLSGVYFGIFDPKVTGEEIRYGNNCVPNIEVEHVDQLHDRLKDEGVTIVMPLQNVNGTRIFQCIDSENNVLEFYQWL